MCVISRPSGLKYEKAKEWRIPCVNAQWLCEILLGNFEALRQIQHSRYTQFNLAEPLAPNTHLVQNLLGRVPWNHFHIFIIGGFFFLSKVLKNASAQKKSDIFFFRIWSVRYDVATSYLPDLFSCAVRCYCCI